ncbi:MAG: hypothetical protein GY705_30370 [Bacteroidetes bacterium]|nr:hypothetical protein [Bacteroidota bacterium]
MIPVIGASNEPVLIQGEPGVGKELVARSILSWSGLSQSGLNRSGNPDNYSTKIDASLITCKDIEGELLCFRNDDVRNEKKRKAVAGNRTIVLNMLEKMEKDVQSEFLLMVDNLSKNNDTPCSLENNGVRFISTANDTIGSLIENGRFRKDLYYRLGVLKLRIPPLRDRVEDILDLADYFALKFSLGQNRTYYKLPGYIKKIFIEYHWPGNVQELSNIVKRLALNEDEASIANYLKNKLHNIKGRASNSGEKLIDECFDEINEAKKNLMGKKDIHLKKISEEISSKTEIKLLSHALYKTNWNRKKSAQLLNVSYKALLNKIKIYKLDQT